MTVTFLAAPFLTLFFFQSGAEAPLSEARALRQVAIERADRIVREAVQLAKRDPEASRLALENARREVDNSIFLPEDRRLAHLKLVRAATDRLQSPGPMAILNPPRRLPGSIVQPPASASTSAPTGSVADIARGMIGNNRDALTRQAGARAVAATNRDGALRRVEAGIPDAGQDIALPRDWAEKTALRSSEGRLTGQQKKMIAGLNKTITAKMDNIDLESFFNWIGKQMDVTILVDKIAVETIGVGMQTEVSVNARSLAARSVLRKVLAELGMAYVVTEDGLRITSLEVAKNTMVTRAHYVGDLVYAVTNYQFQPLPRQYNSAFSWYGLEGLALVQQQAWNAQWANQLQMNQNAQSLIDLVKGTGDPESWEPVGQGRVTYDPITKSLIVKQTAEYHFRNGP